MNRTSLVHDDVYAVVNPVGKSLAAEADVEVEKRTFGDRAVPGAVWKCHKVTDYTVIEEDQDNWLGLPMIRWSMELKKRPSIEHREHVCCRHELYKMLRIGYDKKIEMVQRVQGKKGGL